eukprot:gene9368-18473_t
MAQYGAMLLSDSGVNRHPIKPDDWSESNYDQGHTALSYGCFNAGGINIADSVANYIINTEPSDAESL